MQIELMIGAASKDRTKPPQRSWQPRQNFTHFLSISFATEEIKSNFARFKSEVQNHPETRQLHDSLFQTPEKIHITISMLVLSSDEDEQTAVECLKECKSTIIDPVLNGEPLTVKVAGVGIFSDCKPSAVNVVFGKVQSEPLQQLANEMARFFESRGFIKLDSENVKLHLTLINTWLFNDGAAESEEQRNSARQIKKAKFDSTSILEKYKDFHFGSLVVDEIHISKLNVKVENGYYESAGILKL